MKHTAQTEGSRSGRLALGHPYAASGTQVAGTLINALQRCGGGVGLGTAVVLNVLAPAA